MAWRKTFGIFFSGDVCFKVKYSSIARKPSIWTDRIGRISLLELCDIILSLGFSSAIYCACAKSKFFSLRFHSFLGFLVVGSSSTGE
jgi:hypothetical protein